MAKQDQKIKELEDEVRRLKASVSELRVLNDIAVSSGKAADIDHMLNLILQKSINSIQSEQGSILLVTKEKKDPLITFVRQDDTSSLQHEYHIGSNITGWVLFNKKPLIIEDLSKDKRFRPTEEEKRDIHSVLCVPIWFEGAIIGLLMLINKKHERAFSENDLTLLSIISVQAGQLIKNMELQRERFRERKETEKLQEIDRVKTNFFTNVSHEFKTPLTLILGPAKNILESSDYEKIKKDAETIIKNAKKINSLTNQLLELSKIEAGQVKLKTAFRNVLADIREIVSSFLPFAESKAISLELSTSEDEISGFFDRDKIEKILGNLISNAIKFTPQNGSVQVKVTVKNNTSGSADKHLSDKASEIKQQDRRLLEIAVSDNGIGISKEDLGKIFDRFSQVGTVYPKEQEGTGIGLSFAKELVELHKGKISVASKPGKGSIFSLEIPIDKVYFRKDEITEMVSPPVSVSSERSAGPFIDERIDHLSNDRVKEALDHLSSTDKPLVLIVEDNIGVRDYLSGILKNEYRVNEAGNGREGLSAAFKNIPDLIISDIMMPVMDGISLCNELKTDMRTSHIPIILLTAKTAVTDRIEGLKTGADDYIIKPFEESELRARIDNLLRQRKRLHDHFRTLGYFIDTEMIAPSDQKFILQTTSLINEHIADPDYSVELLADDLAVSRSLLHKKLIALIGEAPGDLIRRIRLNLAAKLIEQKSGNISEIALEVGFNNPSYFAKCFQKQFGFSPSQYHQNFLKQS